MTRAPSASISLLTSLMRRGFDCSVFTPAAVTLVRRTYVATALPPVPYSARAYADVHTHTGRGAPSESETAARGSSAPEAVLRSTADGSGREGDQRAARRGRAPRRRSEGSG